ncbi:MAG: hypothetical protein ACRELF_06595 [Gemmataceae bacterium]
MLQSFLTRLVYAVAATCALAASGCSSSGVKTVKGSVRLDGKPLAGAAVEFVPRKDLTLGAFGGRTKADGRFEIVVGGSGMTVKPGRYVVLVFKKKGIDTPASLPANAKDEDLKELMRQTAPGAIPSALPPGYDDRNRSPFIVDIHEGTTELDPLELSTTSPVFRATRPMP